MNTKKITKANKKYKNILWGDETLGTPYSWGPDFSDRSKMEQEVE